MTLAEWILGSFLILSSFGVILLKKPVHASLSFLFMLLSLSALYVELSAQFIAVMQILVYAGAILVIFMFVIILFQDVHQKIEHDRPKSFAPLLIAAAVSFLIALVFLGRRWVGITASEGDLPEGFGTVESLGKELYIDYFFPFEAVILIFLIAIVGALYTARKRT